MMKLLMTGGTGLIGRALIERLQHQYEVHVLTRNKTRAYNKLGHALHAWEELTQLPDMSEFDAVINLQGEPIADKRWSDKQKQQIESSRWHITEQLSQAIQHAPNPPKVFISGSAIGYYGSEKGPASRHLDEHSDPLCADSKNDFAHQLCHTWEQLALSADSDKTRVCVLRTAVVLAAKGGALQKMKLPYQLGLGGPLGDGLQPFSWIHIDDMVGIILYLLEHPDCRGIYNAAAPNPLPQYEFSAALAKALHRPHVMRVPAFLLRAALGEMSEMLLRGQAVIPARIQQAGYRFRYANVDKALQALFHQS